MNVKQQLERSNILKESKLYNQAEEAILQIISADRSMTTHTYSTSLTTQMPADKKRIKDARELSRTSSKSECFATLCWAESDSLICKVTKSS